MTRTLLTGGSGFIAAHVLDLLLEHGHSVVTTVRSQAKADKIKEAHPKATKDQLDFAIVEDIAKEGAFDDAVKSDPPFEVVIHTASPFHFNTEDIQKDLLDPAFIGTTGVLKAIKKNAPTVKRVVITSSFAAIINANKGLNPGYTYTSSDWNPVTQEQALGDTGNGYRASKTFAENAAWDFVEKERPNFSLATINPPLVFGPIVHYLNDLKSINTSNSRVLNFIQGNVKDEIPETGIFIWVDVRDVALAHVKAAEVPEAAQKRFFVTAGYFSNKELVEIIRRDFPDLASKLPSASAKGGRRPEEIYSYDTTLAQKTLGIKYRSLDECIPDLVKSLQAVGA